MEEADIEFQMAEKLRMTILSGALPPGTKLPEETLADTFGVSRTRVRPVLQRLSFECLVDIRKNKGAFIATPNPKEAKDVFETRRIIERANTDVVARTISTAAIGKLRTRIADQEVAAMQGDRQKAIKESGEFHRDLAQLAHNEVMVSLLHSLILRTSLIVALYGGPRTLKNAIIHQQEVVDELEAGRPVNAGESMELCLYAIEKDLDLFGKRDSKVDLARIISSIAA